MVASNLSKKFLGFFQNQPNKMCNSFFDDECKNCTIVVILEECISTHTGGESDFKSHLFFVTGCIIDCFPIRHPLRNDGCGK